MKQHILEITEQLVLAKGFNSTSIADICEHAGISKGGFFHSFKNKNALARALILHFAAKIEAMMLAGVDPSIDEPKQKLFHFLDHMLLFAKDPERVDGCVIGIACQELAFCGEDYQQAIIQGFAPGLKIVFDLLQAFKQSNKLSFDVEQTAYFFLSIVQGSMLIARGTANHQHLYNNIKQFKTYLETL